MGTFRYRAKESTGNTVDGFIEAVTEDEAIEKVSQLGYIPMRIEETASQQKKQVEPGAPAAPPSERPKISTISSIKSKEITAFGRQLASLIRAGVPILRAIGLVSEQSQNAHFKELLSRVHEEVKNGTPLSAALSRYPKFFPPIYIALVSAGEKTGTLDQTLTKITAHRQKQEELFSRVRTAMIYPALMALTGTGTIVFMLTFVMPRLIGIFSNLGGDLPAPTKILIQTSNALRTWWVWVIVAVVVIIFIALFKAKQSGKNLVLSSLELKLPVFGPLIQKTEIARFSRTLELLIKSDIQIVQAIEAATPVLGNQVFKLEFIHCLQDLKEGGSFGKSLRKSKRFPIFMTNLIVIGEEAGKLDEALSEVADFYERESDEAIRAMTALLEPLLILAMGLVVGFIVIAMLLPMFEINMMVK